MGMCVIKDKNEIFDILEEQIAQLEKKPQLNISVKGLDLSDEDTARIKSQIQQLVIPELIKYQQARLQEAKIKKQRIHDKSAINVSLKGLPLPDEEIKRLESKIQQVVKRMLPRESQDPQILENPPQICVCSWPFWGYACEPPGTEISLNDIDPLPPWPSDGRPLYIGIYFPEDVVLMIIENGARYGMRPDQMWVGLQLDNSFTNIWAKEIWAWGPCIGTVSWIRQERASNNPVWMQISRDETATIFFKKARIFGLMGDMYNFPSKQFWRLLGGNLVTFVWIEDRGHG